MLIKYYKNCKSLLKRPLQLRFIWIYISWTLGNSYQAVFSATDLKVATGGTDRNSEDDVFVIDGEGVSPGGHLSGVQSLAIDAHVQLRQFELAGGNQRVHVPGQEPGDRVGSEVNAAWKEQEGKTSNRFRFRGHKVKSCALKMFSLPFMVGQAAAALISHFFSKMVEVWSTVIGTPATCRKKCVKVPEYRQKLETRETPDTQDVGHSRQWGSLITWSLLVCLTEPIGCKTKSVI